MRCGDRRAPLPEYPVNHPGQGIFLWVKSNRSDWTGLVPAWRTASTLVIFQNKYQLKVYRPPFSGFVGHVPNDDFAVYPTRRKI